MSSTRIRNCLFAFKCDKQWGDLIRTSFEKVRFCTDCSRDVFFCSTDSELAEAVRLNRCVAVAVVSALPTDMHRRKLEEQILLGVVNPVSDFDEQED
ncbi:MAG: hypothetical protein AB7T07_14555 [Steroidobacteraceae bacterium]